MKKVSRSFALSGNEIKSTRGSKIYFSFLCVLRGEFINLVMPARGCEITAMMRSYCNRDSAISGFFNSSTNHNNALP
jgi:hypothetical protein